jgi:multidrug efflux pump subunit AcrB
MIEKSISGIMIVSATLTSTIVSRSLTPLQAAALINKSKKDLINTFYRE